jgi:hypothetical protein
LGGLDGLVGHASQAVLWRPRPAGDAATVAFRIAFVFVVAAVSGAFWGGVLWLATGGRRRPCLVVAALAGAAGGRRSSGWAEYGDAHSA